MDPKREIPNVKRIVICADGTWNLRDQVEDGGRRRPTNVTKIARAVRLRDDKGVDQVVFYHDGIGTRGPLDKLTGGAFGSGMAENVRNLYRSIVYNYADGDELFFFGFSRGAFTVRTLAGFMNHVGLIDKDADYFLPEIYACYEKRRPPGSKQWQTAFAHVNSVRKCPEIKFIGVWDTVGALGAPGLIGKAASLVNGNKYAYHQVGLHPHIRNAYHALAIDERRRPFKPTLFEATGWTGTLEQAWFPGVHCNVGGGYYPDGLANEPLHWIAEKAEALGLALDEKYLAPFLPCLNSKRHNSMSLKYLLFLPYRRPIGRTDASEVLHQTTLDRRSHFNGTSNLNDPWGEEHYAPKNVDEFLAGTGGRRPVAQTIRVKRGIACAPGPKPRPWYTRLLQRLGS
jgi:hypothetical protein